MGLDASERLLDIRKREFGGKGVGGGSLKIVGLVYDKAREFSYRAGGIVGEFG